MFSRINLFGLGFLYGTVFFGLILNLKHHFVPLSNILLTFIVVVAFNIFLLIGERNQ